MYNSIYLRTIFLLIVERLQKLLELEAIHGTLSEYTPTINQLIDYYKQVGRVAMSDICRYSYVYVWILKMVIPNKRNRKRKVRMYAF